MMMMKMKKKNNSGYWRSYKLMSMSAQGFAWVLLLLLSGAGAGAATAVRINQALETVDKDSGVPNSSMENKASTDEESLSSTINRAGGGGCRNEDIFVNQGPTDPLPSGIPTYTVTVQNDCVSENCAISNIHISCEWFASARLINPRIFRRLGYNDCLVNDGKPLNPGQSLVFQYANTFSYPMDVSSVAC